MVNSIVGEYKSKLHRQYLTNVYCCPFLTESITLLALSFKPGDISRPATRRPLAVHLALFELWYQRTDFFSWNDKTSMHVMRDQIDYPFSFFALH